MSEAAFAFLMMTAEEEHSDLKVYARPNVIHEVGLFQNFRNLLKEAHISFYLSG